MTQSKDKLTCPISPRLIGMSWTSWQSTCSAAGWELGFGKEQTPFWPLKGRDSHQVRRTVEEIVNIFSKKYVQ